MSLQCASESELSVRLWNNFKWKGYIHPDLTYDVINKTEPTTDEVRTHLEHQLTDAMAAGLREPQVLNQSKEDFLKACFQSLSLETMTSLLRKHRLDIKLFGYEKERDKILDWTINNATWRREKIG